MKKERIKNEYENHDDFINKLKNDTTAKQGDIELMKVFKKYFNNEDSTYLFMRLNKFKTLDDMTKFSILQNSKGKQSDLILMFENFFSASTDTTRLMLLSMLKAFNEELIKDSDFLDNSEKFAFALLLKETTDNLIDSL